MDSIRQYSKGGCRQQWHGRLLCAVAAISLLFAATTSWAQMKLPVSPQVKQQVISQLKKARPDLDFSNVRPSPIPGLYQVALQGDTVFVSADGSFLIAGDMYQVMDGHMVNLQERERQEAEAAFAPERAKMLDAVAKEDMVIYPAIGETKHHVYVFTDIDCGFCRKLHRQLPEMQAQGIEVRYLAFPRAGISSASAQKLVTTWCGDNPQDLMTRFKKGEKVAISPCKDNPIADQWMLGQQVGVRGTPAVILPHGTMIPGAVGTLQLLGALEEEQTRMAKPKVSSATAAQPQS